jgi:23S rRNA pseudouridine1911/1915/1917 synthase
MKEMFRKAKIMKQTLIVEENEQTRLDSYISNKMPEISRMAVKRLLDEEKIYVNNKIQKPSYKVNKNDKIEIEITPPKEVELEAQDIPIDIVYEDNDILVVNKPKGLVVHPANGNPDGTLVNAIMAHCKDSLSGIGGELRPGIVHRLDKDTSGLLIVAKNDKAHIAMSEQIKNRKVKKTYIALVRGTISENEATINMPIGRSTKDRKKMAVTKNGKEAITHFKVLNRFTTSKASYCLLEIKIDTGRTHQIRVHMAEIGHPVVGDMVYSNGKNEFGIEGQCLHAKRLEFNHPITGEHMVLEADLPEYFQDVINTLE